ncbi:MAG: hypothetical protein HPY66_2101 [Firmicutes bacterium]|nr:hypothetical protein [Bacillota bacterium]
MNAAIEAARAGEAGRGFSVVADEVRKLAEQSTGFAGKIKVLVEGIMSEINEIVKEMELQVASANDSIEFADSARASFNQIQVSAQKAMDAVASIHSLALDEAREAKSIDGIMEEISAVVEQFAANTQETSASAEEQTASMEQIFSSIKQLNTMTQEIFDVSNSLIKNFKYTEESQKLVKDSMEIIKEVARDPALGNKSWDASNAIIKKYREKHSQFIHLGIMDEKGIYCNDIEGLERGLDFSHRDYFKEAIKGNEYKSEPRISVPYYVYNITVSCPIKQRDRITGVVVGEVALS